MNRRFAAASRRTANHSSLENGGMREQQRRPASPQARQGCALAAAEEPRLDAARRGCRTRRTARRQPRPVRGLCVARCAEDLWGYRHAGHAARAWRSWYRKALRSRIEPLRRFARNLRPYLPGILAHCRWPLGTNLVEGINNKIKEADGLRLPRRRLLLP
jgi:transposase